MEKEEMNKEEAIRRIDDLIYRYAKNCFGDNAESIVANIKNNGKSSSWDDYPIEVAIEASEDISDDPIRNYYIYKYVESDLAYETYESVLYNEGLL